MARWVRRRGNVIEWWHLLDEDRIPLIAACGEQLGEDRVRLEVVDDESIMGNRCAYCQSIALARGTAR